MSYRRSTKQVLIAILMSVVLGWVGGAVPATILTNVGQVADGTLTGLAPVLRLLATDGVRSIGPGPQFDIPLISIRQITIDFPRIVIESETQTWIGPYSAFRGIAQSLQLDRAGEPTVTIPTSSLRAIALNGHALRPVPRVWLGDGYLSMPEIAGATPFAAEECEDCTITPPLLVTSVSSTDDSETIWNGYTPEYIPEEPQELPWWVGLIGVAALVVVATLLTSSAAPSS